MAAERANPIVEALLDDIAGRLGDVDALQRVQRNADLVRAEIDVYAALHADAAAELAQAHGRLVEAALNSASPAARRAFQEPPPPGAGGLVVLPLDDPEVAARADDYVDAEGRVELIRQHEVFLVEALVFLAAARAVAFALRVHLLPRVLVTVAAAYALAYVVSCGAVVPGPTSVLRIAVLVLCFLLGTPVVGNLP